MQLYKKVKSESIKKSKYYACLRELRLA